MPSAILKCYIAVDGTNVLRNWYAALDGRVKGDFRGAIELLEHSECNRWKYAAVFKSLEKRVGSHCLGISEIIVDQKGHDYRILGFCGPSRNEFTMLYVFDKSIDAKYKEPCVISQERKAEVIDDHRRSQYWEFPPVDEDWQSRS